MSISALLTHLEHQLTMLAEAVRPFAHIPAQQARFDRNLFHADSQRLRDCLSETEKNMAQLREMAQINHREQVLFLAERLVAQMEALQRELATQKLRESNVRRAPYKSHDIYQQLAEHQDYERRLQQMLTDRETLLGKQETLAAQQKIQREIAALEGRLQRCRQALTRIERIIERRENGH